MFLGAILGQQNSCSMAAHLTDEGLAMRKRMWLSLQT